MWECYSTYLHVCDPGVWFKSFLPSVKSQMRWHACLGLCDRLAEGSSVIHGSTHWYTRINTLKSFNSKGLCLCLLWLVHQFCTVGCHYCCHKCFSFGSECIYHQNWLRRAPGIVEKFTLRSQFLLATWTLSVINRPTKKKIRNSKVTGSLSFWVETITLGVICRDPGLVQIFKNPAVEICCIPGPTEILKENSAPEGSFN